MAGKTKTTKASPKKKTARSTSKRTVRARLRRAVLWCVGGVLLVAFLLIAMFAVFNPPTTYYMSGEERRLGNVSHRWVGMEEIAPVMARSAVAAEDANYCLHWGFDMAAIRDVIAAGQRRGASTISQQVVKNVYLWHGRSWTRKALEAVVTPFVELVWTKRRILEVYLNVAEFDEGVFGIEAASRKYFKTSAAQLTPVQAARLAMVLPAPKSRSASSPTDALRARSASILDGAETIRRDGRADCFGAGS